MTFTLPPKVSFQLLGKQVKEPKNLVDQFLLQAKNDKWNSEEISKFRLEAETILKRKNKVEAITPLIAKYCINDGNGI